MSKRKIFWNPTNIELTHLYKFAAEFLPKEIDKTSYFDIYQWSIKHTEEFWKNFIQYSKIPIEGNLEKTIAYGEQFIDTKFFPNAKINFAECILKPYLNSSATDNTVIYSFNEKKTITKITAFELLHNIKKLQSFFLENGLQKGDRVAAYLPNIPETIYVMLACTSLGAVFSSCSPDFGKNAVLSRFSQIQPKFFFFADGYFYKGKKISKIQE
ncbi:MAG: AMP-binding protein, partial [Leptospiraceae bacterium]|nr:AMP-binding protein [Leptospiraceae bacterium]